MVTMVTTIIALSNGAIADLQQPPLFPKWGYQMHQSIRTNFATRLPSRLLLNYFGPCLTSCPLSDNKLATCLHIKRLARSQRAVVEVLTRGMNHEPSTLSVLGRGANENSMIVQIVGEITGLGLGQGSNPIWRHCRAMTSLQRIPSVQSLNND